MFPSVSTRTYQLAPATSADGSVAATFRSVGTREIGVIFRWSDANNFWLATKNELKKVVAGVKQDPASGVASWSAFLPDERLTVTLSGSSITVKRDGVTIATATDSFNSTATRHGVVAEA